MSPVELERKVRQIDNDVQSIYELMNKISTTQLRHGNRITELTEMVAAHDARFDGVDARFDGVDARFDGVDARFDGVDARFDGVDSRLDGVDARLERIGTSLDRIIELLGDGSRSTD